MPGSSGAAFFNRGFDTALIREDLVSQNEQRQHTALQQVVAYMTVGKDMSAFFNEIAGLSSCTSVVIKRLAFIYLMQNSWTQPEKAVLQAGMFVKDTLNDSPLVRGAALRTMTSLQISVMSDFITAPLRRCMDDSDPYVASIAALGVLKQYCTSTTVAFETGLLDKLSQLLKHENHMVVAAAVQSMLELYQRNAPDDLLSTLIAARPHLMAMLDESTEWSTYYLLEGIAVSFDQTMQSSPEYIHESEEVIIRVLPFVCSADAATVLAAAKVLARFLVQTIGTSTTLEEAERTRIEERYAPRLVHCLVSQLAAPRYEMRYIILRNIELFTTTRLRSYFKRHLHVFLVTYEDPIFVKLEKLEMLVALADEANGTKILAELMTYSRETDMDLVHKAIRSISVLAVTVPSLSAACVERLKELIHTNVPHIVEDAAVVVQTILRRYPGTFLDIIPVLCGALSVMDGVDPKAAVAWVLGEYTSCVPDAMAYLDVFLENYMGEPRMVQLAVLTALVKMYLNGGREAEHGAMRASLERVLAICTNSPLPDLRDRAYFYWRLLALDADKAKRILAETAVPVGGATTVEASTQQELIRNMGRLTSVQHLPLRYVLGNAAVGEVSDANSDVEDEEAAEAKSDDDDDDGHAGRAAAVSQFAASSPAAAEDTESMSPVGAQADVASASSRAPSRSFGHSRGSSYQLVLEADACSGVEVSMAWTQSGNKLVLSSRFRLYAGVDYVSRARIATLQVNWNMFGLGVSQVFPKLSLEPDDKPSDVGLIMSGNNGRLPVREVQVALAVEPVGVRYFLAPPIPASMLLLPATGYDPFVFLNLLKELPTPAWSMPPQVTPLMVSAARMTANGLRVHGLNLIYRKELGTVEPTVAFFLYAETIAHQRLLIEVTTQQDVVMLLSVRCKYAPLAPFFGEYILQAFATTSAS